MTEKKDTSPIISQQTARYALAVSLLIAVIAWVIRLHVMVDLWTWFAVPLGAPVMTWAQIWGVLLFVAVFRPPVLPETPKGDMTQTKLIEMFSGTFVHIGFYFIIWGIGYALWAWA